MSEVITWPNRTAILGAGAVGGCIGAYLAREGHDVTLIDQWPEHVDRMKRHGLTVRDPEKAFTVPVKALHLCEVSGLQDQFDIVFLAVKSYDTLWSTHFIAPYLKPMGLMLSAQNGMNDDVVASVVGLDRTAGCVVQLGAATYEPGHVVRTEPVNVHTFAVGELSGEATSRVRNVADILTAVGPSEVTSNIGGARWSKMVVNCMGNALAGLLGPAASSLSPGTAGACRPCQDGARPGGSVGSTSSLGLRSSRYMALPFRNLPKRPHLTR